MVFLARRASDFAYNWSFWILWQNIWFCIGVPKLCSMICCVWSMKWKNQNEDFARKLIVCLILPQSCMCKYWTYFKKHVFCKLISEIRFQNHWLESALWLFNHLDIWTHDILAYIWRRYGFVKPIFVLVVLVLFWYVLKHTKIMLNKLNVRLSHFDMCEIMMTTDCLNVVELTWLGVDCT